MKRQLSILSFFKEPEPIVDEVKGIDTPPEKVPRKVLPDGGDSLFSSIKHKFSKLESSKKPPSENRVNLEDIALVDTRSAKYHGPEFLDETGSSPIANFTKNAVFTERQVGSGRGKSRSFPKCMEDDILGSEKPIVKSLVPGLKRVQKDTCDYEKKTEFHLHDQTKKVKLQQDSGAVNKSIDLDSGVLSKFEWLHPSRIKDANGRKPSDPLYDAKTLYIPSDALKKMTASQRQYWDVKRNYMDVILFFKVGKFYELYELDAEVGHKELDWKITLSGVGKCRQVGVSESGIDDAVEKLIARGYKVGRMEQLETSEHAKSRGAASVIPRKLIHVLTPATSYGSSVGPDAVHLLSLREDCSIGSSSNAFGFAFVDCASLKFWVGSIDDDAACSALGSLLAQVSPKEIIYENQGLSNATKRFLKKYTLTGSTMLHLNPSDTFGEASEVEAMLQSKNYFNGSWSHAFDGIELHDLALCAVGGLINHLSRLMLDDLLRNGDIFSYEVFGGFLRLDGQTLANLEIFNNNSDGGLSGTLYKYLDNCVTSFGKRLLRNWISHPLQDAGKINNRLAVVEDFMASPEIMANLSQLLRKLPDMERLLGRVKSSLMSSKVLLLPFIGKRILKQRVRAFGSLIKGLRTGVQTLLVLQDNEMMPNFSKIVDLPAITGPDLDDSLAQFEAAIDSDFANYQDHTVIEGDAETLSVLIELFLDKAAQWSQVIYAISCIDVLRSFASSAMSSCGVMCRPTVLPCSKVGNSSIEATCPLLVMKGLWHPYALCDDGAVPVPNDVHLGDDKSSYTPGTLLLTGPNMGGKSTLLRATCLSVILAQLGSYVPCEECTLSIVDTIFTRLGATDRIMTGESTFLVECSETASILQHATQNSLVLLDELGRGTSTFDGYAIAYAVLRHLIESVNCRLLFATHYHSLTKEFASHPRVKLQHMAYSFESTPGSSSDAERKLVFLYRLASGACPESYGMQIALMAGIPKSVIEAASKAGLALKGTVGQCFKSSEQRENFSSYHEECLKLLISMSSKPESDFNDGMWDSLCCLWHEIRSLPLVG